MSAWNFYSAKLLLPEAGNWIDEIPDQQKKEGEIKLMLNFHNIFENKYDVISRMWLGILVLLGQICNFFSQIMVIICITVLCVIALSFQSANAKSYTFILHF